MTTIPTPAPGRVFNPKQPAPPHLRIVQEELRHTTAVLDAMATYLDLAKPVVVILGAVVRFLDDYEAEQLMAALRQHLVPGSVVLVTHVTSTGVDPRHGGQGEGGLRAGARRLPQHPYLRRDRRPGGRTRHPGARPVPTIDFIPGDDNRGPVREAPHFLMVLAKRLPA